MQPYFGALTIILLLGTVLTRAAMLRRRGVQAMNFGKLDKTDFLIPPFAFFYFYLVFANAFDWPIPSTQQFFHSEIASWLGVLFCFSGLSLLLWSLVSFRLQPQSHLRSLLLHPAGPVPDLLELDPARLHGRGRLALPPSGTA